MPLREPLFLRETDHGVIAQECTNKGRALLIDFDMDYEKKYKEALERAEDFKNGIVQFALDPGESIVHYIFPELRESEDERIRKNIVATIEQCPDDFLNPKNRDRMLEWLEKQKEHHIPWYDYQKSKEAGYTIVPNEEYEQLIKQKKQKPNYCHYGGDPSVERCKHCSTVCSGRLVEERYSPLCNTIKDKIHEYIANHFIADTVVKTDMKSIVKAMEEGVRLGKEEQKPAENQDYSGLNDLERTIHRGFLSAGVKNVSVTIIKETARECLAQMNSAEWSEDDERIIKDAIYALEEVGGYHYTVKGLKSLSPQPHKEIYQAAKRDLAIKFMNYLDENRPEGKMSLSNGECKDIDKAFKENDWAKIMRYYEKYQPHWKPSEDEERLINTAISFLKDFADKGYENAVECIDWLKSKLNGNSGK